MTFQPVVPMGGLAGWKVLSQTRARQEEVFSASPSVQRDTDYFEQKIGEVRSAEDLVSDYRLLKVALGAFGLDDDISNRFYIRKVLEGGTLDPESLANRLTDKRYFEMAKTFGFDVSPPFTVISDFGPKITEAYRERQFEIAVGRQSEDMRLAMALDRDLGALLDKNMTENGVWFSIMGNPPLRAVFDQAMGVPDAIGTADIDKQLEFYKRRATAVFGSSDPSQFADPEKLEALRARFLTLSADQVGPSATTRGSAALALLQGTSGSGLLGILA